MFDPEPAKIEDLAAQFYLTEAEIGHRRDYACQMKLAELNEYVPVSILEGANTIEELDAKVLSRFQVVVVADQPLNIQNAINSVTHGKNIAFISSNICGLFASAFCDFGSGFVVADATGEPPIVGMINGITKDSMGIVACLEETRHGLEDGDFVTFREVKGMCELNNCIPRQIKVLGPYTFSIGDTSSFGEHQTGSGAFEQVKQPKILDFSPLSKSLVKPQFLISDFAKMDRQEQLHIAFQVLSSFFLKTGSYPRPRHLADAEEFVAMAKALASDLIPSLEIDEALLREFSFEAAGYLAPMAAFLGGFIAQEVLKACSGKFHPVMQHFYYDALECLDTGLLQSLTPDLCAAQGSRYDGQIAVFGKEYHARLQSLKGFVVGAGAIGCELLKILSLMGVGSGEGGYVEVTDMDTIEKSNLNRQFLFRPRDVSKPKSRTAAEAACQINPDMKGHLRPRLDRVGAETENIFDDTFFAPLDFVANALDNMEARKYVDLRCVFYRKPLLESGTLGTKGNTQVVIPHITESYSSSQDPPEKTIPFCTLHNFPNSIEHTIQWAMDQFHGLFRSDAETTNLFLGQPEEFIASLSKSGQTNTERLERVLSCLVSDRPESFEACVAWARLRFEEFFANNIKQLLFNFPRDAVTSTGAAFWSGPKRAPSPINFDDSNPMHMDFILAGANLRAENFGLKGSSDERYIRQILATVMVPDFVPRSGVKIAVNENEAMSNSASAETPPEDIQELAHALPDPKNLIGFRLFPIEFEKDDDSNFHVAFVAATANLRACNYEIAPAERHKIKQIAGKIIPAIATTTAVVAGLISLELYKLVLGSVDITRFKNGFINLALPFCAFSEPIPAQVTRYNDVDWTIWDRFEVDGNPTLGELIDLFKERHKIVITMLSYGSSMLFGFVRSQEVLRERMAMKLTDLVEHVSKKPIPAHCTFLVLEILAEDMEGEDAEVPYILVKFR